MSEFESRTRTNGEDAVLVRGKELKVKLTGDEIGVLVYAKINAHTGEEEIEIALTGGRRVPCTRIKLAKVRNISGDINFDNLFRLNALGNVNDSDGYITTKGELSKSKVVKRKPVMKVTKDSIRIK